MFNHVQSYGYDLARATVDGKNLDSTSAYSFAKYHQEKTGPDVSSDQCVVCGKAPGFGCKATKGDVGA